MEEANVFSPIGDLLELRLDNYGDAVSTFNIVACLRSATHNPRPTLESLFEKHHKYLATLPKIAFHRKLRRVTIEFESKVRTAEDEASRRFSVEIINAAMLEFNTILPLLEKRLKKNHDFDCSRFFSDANRLLSQGFGSEEEIERIKAQAKEKRQTERAAKNPWDLLEIDWSKFHPNARAILDDTFFWECADDFAPHGSDTGADLLADYQRSVKRNSDVSSMVFLDHLFSGWGLLPIDWNVTDEREVRKLMETKGVDLFVSNDAIVALAIAVLKVKGECPRDVVEMALKALQRKSYDFMEDGMEEKHKTLRREAIAKMRAKLERH